MTDQEMEEIARGNIERHLADVSEEYEEEYEVGSEEYAGAIYDEAYTLGFDALADAGVDHLKAGEIATRVAQCFAQP